MIASPYLPLKLYTNKVQLPEIDPSFEQFLSIVVKEIKLNQQHGILEKITDLNKTNSIEEEINIEHQKFKHKQLKEKLTLLEDFRKVTDFEYIESLSNEEYLMKYVTPILTKLIVQVAKVRPKNPVDFLAYMALKENPEGLPNLPGYSKGGVNIPKILDRMFQLYNYDENEIIKSKSLMDVLIAHYTDEEDPNSEEELFKN
ncbi:adenylate kinase 7-like [Metopolophium dirhodum]|uniref:adenylate kinase 7-like n=1 Tax=Metopolophium dirhodum TaxID=44670 RepID=UPI00298FF579|nr:adenylate kinase 7-like [Metopolophium dirhodum]